MAKRTPEQHRECQRQARLNKPEHYKALDKKKYEKRANLQCAAQKLARETNPENYIYKQIKSRSKRLGIEFNLEKSDIVIPKVCPILGIPLFMGDKKLCDNSPSVDRVDNSKGYVKGNIRIISFKANRYKSDMDKETVEKLLDYMNTHLSIQTEGWC